MLYKEIIDRGISLNPNAESVILAEDYVSHIMEESDIPVKTVNKVSVAVDEMYSNVVAYSEAKEAAIYCETTDNMVKIVLADNGVQFDPLTKENPDVSLALEEREPGGLGIYMTKKIMDEVSYCYEDGYNIVTLVKYY